MRNSAVTGGGFRLWSPRAKLRAAALMAMVLGATIAAGVMPGTAQAQVPPARALFLNLDTVFTQSAVGKDIRGQLEAMPNDNPRAPSGPPYSCDTVGGFDSERRIPSRRLL